MIPIKTVLVIFGGVSSEHDVSLVSASSVIENIPKDKYSVLSLGITKDGRWLFYTGEPDKLPDGRWLEDEALLTPAVFSPDSVSGGLILLENGTARPIKVDAVFPVLHGKNGEDGTMQGLLELSGVPFVGCPTLASALCMDKAVANAVADAHNITQAKWLGFTKYEYTKNANALLNNAVAKLGLPIFVKPANTGSSVGVSKAKNAQELVTAVELAFNFDKKVVLEEAVDGMEVECAVLGNDETLASVPGEVVPCHEFYDYDAKYITGTSQLYIPARLTEEKLKEVQNRAAEVYKALDCRGLARVDFFVRKNDGAVLLNEVNTIPGFTSISMYPKMFEASGIPYPELLDRLIQLAFLANENS